MSTIEEINSALDRIWLNSQKGFPYAPFQYAMPMTGAILYVGLNPSFSERGWNTIIERAGYPGPPPKEVFAWPRNAQYDINNHHALESAARQHYSYFKHHRKFAEARNAPWNHFEHFDLFAYRATNQNDIRELVLNPDETLNAFGAAQFEQFVKLLKLADPAVVIVINALAARIYRHGRNLAETVDPVTGYRIDEIKGRKVPVFLSGMLTGGATDKYSRERLFWHVEQALNRLPLA